MSGASMKDWRKGEPVYVRLATSPEPPNEGSKWYRGHVDFVDVLGRVVVIGLLLPPRMCVPIQVRRWPDQVRRASAVDRLGHLA